MTNIDLDAVRRQLTAPGAPFELVDVDLHGGRAPAYRNAFRSLPELIEAGRVHAGREFMAYGEDRWSFDRFFAAVDALAGRLHHDLGLRPGDRVAIAMRNRPEWAVAFAAAVLVGAVPVPLNSFGLRDELCAALRDVQPRLLVCDVDRLARVADELDGLDCRAISLADGPRAPGVQAFEDLVQQGGPAAPKVSLSPQDPALILFTSGASSQAKAVLSNQRAVCQALFNIDYIGALTAMTSPARIEAMLRRGHAPATLTAVPLFHVSGLHAQLLVSLRHGRRLVFMHRWDPAQAIELIARERITQFNGAPSMVMQLMAQPGFDDPALTGSLAGIGFGGAGLPQRLIDELLERRPDSLSGIGFGMTESNGVAAAASGEIFSRHPRSSGLLSPIIGLCVVGPDGTPLPPMEPGEICLRGVTVMEGYWRKPEATASALREGWLHTGDIGYLDGQGFLHVVDRIKDVINRSGEKIAAAEIESCLLQHPGIEEAAVFGLPDDTTGEAVVAVVVPLPGASPSEAQLREHVRERLAAYKVPRAVHLHDGPLPRNATGKLLKNQIKRQYT
ncbi:class I adenylate-forming enzyme family protein [Caldimonas tepidiphila]|uniref:class I adenylate-forming enzyme family protein n=1 Tax=Caldimonas tepidiphila TaxID=2315841 RepID=UPI000E5B1106|nr:class I adenylate-forming enzyme family protein [Caldimonas tepidiphila]